MSELADALIAVAYAYVASRRALPPHVLADLAELARDDSASPGARHEAWRLVRKAA